MTRCVLSLLCIGSLLALAGCKGTPPKQPAKQPNEGADTNSGPGTVRGNGWHIRWTTRDPNNAKRVIPLLEADAENGSIFYDEDDVPTMHLTGVKAKLFRNADHVANLQAGKLEANREAHTVLASEGVRLVSLRQGREVAVTADHMQWNTDDSTITAEGNAKVERNDHNQRPNSSAEAPRILLNTKTGEYELLASDTH